MSATELQRVDWSKRRTKTCKMKIWHRMGEWIKHQCNLNAERVKLDDKLMRCIIPLMWQRCVDDDLDSSHKFDDFRLDSPIIKTRNSTVAWDFTYTWALLLEDILPKPKTQRTQYDLGLYLGLGCDHLSLAKQWPCPTSGKTPLEV